MTTKITKYRFFKDSESDRITCVQPYANNEWLSKVIPIDDKKGCLMISLLAVKNVK